MKRILLAATCIVLAAGPSWADREAAEFFNSKGEKHLKAQEWDKAEESFRKALEEDETFLPAHLGLAEALLGAGHQSAGLEELRSFIKDAGKAKLEPAWKDLVAQAKKRLDEIDAAGKAIQKIVDDYVDALVALARRSYKEDPAVAEQALRRALSLDGENRGAHDLLKRMGKSLETGIEIFNGKNLDGFTGLVAPIWQCRDGVLIGDLKDDAWSGRSESYFQGDFTVRMEARIEEDYPGDEILGLLAAYRDNFSWYSVISMNGRIIVEEYQTDKDHRTVVELQSREIKGGFDPKKWNTFELRFQGQEVVALLNGEVLSKEPRPKDHGEGFVGIWAQNCKVNVRKLVVSKK